MTSIGFDTDDVGTSSKSCYFVTYVVLSLLYDNFKATFVVLKNFLDVQTNALFWVLSTSKRFIYFLPFFSPVISQYYFGKSLCTFIFFL